MAADPFLQVDLDVVVDLDSGLDFVQVHDEVQVHAQLGSGAPSEVVEALRQTLATTSKLAATVHAFASAIE